MENDVIKITGNDSGQTAIYDVSGIVIEKGLSFQGINGRPILTCLYCQYMFGLSEQRTKESIVASFSNLQFYSNESAKVYPVEIKGLQATNIAVLQIVNCSFTGVTYPILYMCDKSIGCHLLVENCTFIASRRCIRADGNGMLRITINDNVFLGSSGYSISALVLSTYLPVYEMKKLQLYVKRSSFSYFQAAFNLSTSLIRYGDIQIKNCSFKNNMLLLKRLHVAYLGGAAITLYNYVKPLPRSLIQLLVSDSEFSNNTGHCSGAICIKSFKNKVKVFLTRTNFKDNLSMSKGGALSTDGGADVRIRSCTFLNNVCTTLRVGYLGTWINGVGGALAFVPIYAQQEIASDISIRNSVFVNNSAVHSGGSIFSGMMLIRLQNVLLVGPENSRIKPIEGDIITSRYAARFSNVTVVVRNLDNTVMPVKLGEYFGIYRTYKYYALSVDRKSKFLCAEGSVILINQFKMITYPRSYSMFNMYCRACAENSYNLGGSAFRNLSIHKAKCLACPYGANCFAGVVRSKSGFWGFEIPGTREVKLIRLPRGYGCANSQCMRFNSCAVNREGTLCGKCRAGYSESTFSANCVPNAQCGQWFLWSISLLLVIGYVLFFFYKKTLIKSMKGLLYHLLTFRKRTDREIPLLSDHSEETPWANFWSSRTDREENSVEPFTDENVLLHNIDEARAQGGVDLTIEETGQDDFFFDSLVKIVFYFYQAAAVIKSSDTHEMEGRFHLLAATVERVFNFELVPSGGRYSCVLENLTPLSKIWLSVSLNASIFLVLGLVWLLKRVRKRGNNGNANTRRCKSSPLVIVFLEIFLFNYAFQTKTILKLLNCVNVANKTVLYIQGTVACYTKWQYAVIVIGCIWVIPFCLFLLVAAKLIRSGHLKANYVIVCCIFPLPSLVFFFILTRKQSAYTRCPTAPSQLYLIRLLAGPYKNPYGYWEGVYTLRRLILISLCTFIAEPLSKIYSLIIVQLIFLIHHLQIKPFKQCKANLCETISLGSLTFISCMKLFFMYSYITATKVPHDRQLFLRLSSGIEATMLLFVPGILVSLLAVVFISKICHLVLTLSKKLAFFKKQQ
eukprot:gene887-10639_t